MQWDPELMATLLLPEFLKVKNRKPENPETVARLRKEARRRKVVAKANYDRPRTWTPEAEALHAQIKKEKKAKQDARFAALRERAGRK
jgi:hypothetical protein